MILFLGLLSFIHSQIPKEFQELVDDALKKSLNKVPKSLRKETQYPGDYEGEKYHFKLLKILTSSNTNDIKGFSTNGVHSAVIKRKKCSLNDNFVYLEPQTQELYQLNKAVFSENNIIIYETIKTDIFHIMTNFELRSSTDENVNLRSPKRIYNPNAFVDAPIKWDKSTNRPEVQNLLDTDIQLGFGTKGKIGIDTALTFNYIWDVKIAASISMESYIGGEIIIPDDSTIEIPEMQFYELSVPIPKLDFTLNFEGLEISFSFSFNFVVEITNMEVQIPVGFDLFKGFKVNANKYFEITPYSKTNPKWNIDVINLPEINTITEAAKQITESSFTARFQVKPYFTMDINIGEIPFNLDLGLNLPFVFDFNFDSQKCMFPYLAAQISFPFEMHFYFSGLTLANFELIQESEEDIALFELKFGPFCIGGSETFMEENDALIQDSSKTAYHITCSNFSEVLEENVESVLKQIRLLIRDYGSIVEQRFFPYTYYDNNQNSDVVVVIQGIPLTSSLQWILNYKDKLTGLRLSGGRVEYNDYFKFNLIDEHTHYLNVTLNMDPTNNQTTDITNFVSKTEKCQLIQPGKVFIRRWKYISFQPETDFKGQYSMIYFTPEGRLYKNSAQYFSNCMANLDFAQFEKYIETDENYKIYLISLETSFSFALCDIDIYLNYEFNNEKKKVLLGVYTMSNIENKTLYTAKDMGIDGISFNSYIPKSMKSTISVGGKIIWTNYSTFEIEEKIVFDDNMTDQTFTISDWLSVVLGAQKISPSVTVDFNGESSGIIPAQEILAEDIEINDIQMSNQITIHFMDDEMFKFLHINIPNEFVNTNLGIYTSFGSVLTFLYKEKKTVYNENFFYFSVNSEGILNIPIRRSETKEKTYTIQLEFFKFGSSELVVLDNTQGWPIDFNDNIQRAFIMPSSKGISSMCYIGLEEYQCTNHFFDIDESTCLYFRNYTTGVDGTCTFFLSYSYIPDSQPSITIDLTYMKPFLDKNGEFKYYVYCNNGKEVLAETSENSSFTIPIVNGIANFNLKEVGFVTFSPICKDVYGKMCLITYEKPERTGFHLIRYPELDGISTTGAGFYAEVIPVVANQSFKYYKTYANPIIKYAEYSEEPVTVKMTVDDSGFCRNSEDCRKFCLVETGRNQKIPFSRKYFTEHMNDFINIFDLNPENCYKEMDTDEDGCIGFGLLQINSNQIKEPPREACDLPTTGNIEVDTKKMDENPKERGVKKKKLKGIYIALIVVGCLAVVAIVIIIVVKIIKK